MTEGIYRVYCDRLLGGYALVEMVSPNASAVQRVPKMTRSTLAVSEQNRGGYAELAANLPSL